jgi:phospho-N-acetylmuramoyl-pentapeptide-transferase
MLYNTLVPLSSTYPILNVFRYITFRSCIALLTALFISFIIGPYIIRKFKQIQPGGQPIRDDGPESHLVTKAGTPTMGGVIILLALTVSTLLWTDITNIYVWISLFVCLAHGLLGFMDDYLKVSKRNSKGVSGAVKLMVQSIISISAYFALYMLVPDTLRTTLTFPFLKNAVLDLGLFYSVFAAVVIIGASNAVNITDGLDGLATVPIIIVAACFMLISYLIGNTVFANYLQLHHVSGTGELAIFCAAMVGACLGFLWYNAPPAKIFMGDTGSLSLGAAIGVVSVICKHEIVLAIIGGIFVIEALSVIIQVYYFKISKGKRIFKMAPIHHHFEKSGWSETTIVIRFWIIAVIFALIGLSTLKLR